MKNKNVSDQKKSLIEEYKLTQDMIKHFDDLNMRLGTMSQSAILIFIGVAFGLLSQQKQIFIYLFPFVIIFVAISNLLVNLWFRRHRSISRIKLKRILAIEKQLGWKQFSLVDEAIASNKISSIPIRNMIVVYQVALSLLLLAAYFVIICNNGVRP